MAAGIALWPTATVARPGLDRIETLRRDIAAALERNQVPGVGLALVDRRGVIWAGGVGLADVETRRPIGPDTLFRVGSITKSFIGLAAARLHERGHLDLDQPLSQLIPEVAMTNAWEDDAPITLAHVLEHTAGFDDRRFNELRGDGAETMALLDVLARNPRSRVARWRPGSRFSYSNPGYTVAAAAIEAVTQRTYRDLLQRDVFAPLGIADIHFAWNDAVATRLASGYDVPGVATAYAGIYHHLAGTLMTSPRELAVWVHHWLTRSTAVVGVEMLDRIERADTLP